MSILIRWLFILLATSLSYSATASSHYSELENLFKQWRTFESPPLYQGAPDYREQTFKQRRAKFNSLNQTLLAMQISDWSIAQQIDWYLVLAEMNGYDFNQYVLKPWQRDPAFYKSVWTYQSDVPAHEGPAHHGLTELWTYTFPLTDEEQHRLNQDLSVIPPLLTQARQNLTGNAKELWVAGIRDIKAQSTALRDISESIEQTKNASLINTLAAAIEATNGFTQWLTQQASTKTGPSGIGMQQYTWYQQHVHLLPMSWQDEVRLLSRELDRAWSSLKLEEHRNRALPKLVSVKDDNEYQALARRSADYFLKFLDEQNIVTVADYFKPALDRHIGEYVPEATRHFFYIGSHLDPTPLFSHFYHWFELARMESAPNKSLIRRGPLLYNIFDTRNEGTATAVEEIFMHAGLYDHNPRAREIVWIMLAQRAARGLGSLYAHANQMTMEGAGQIHMDWTPRGWMKTEPELLIFEQHFYLRQPGYGTSYVTGKSMLDSALAQIAKSYEEQGIEFELKRFFDQLNGIGNIPILLGTWQMTGEKPKLLEQVEQQARTGNKILLEQFQ
ncbi:hypothetical protein [Aliiglaciecola litoralis]|uniref:DUF885 domain-containing protein n=1 Tax=Aliiglaciecola litoralis TaxID=582857 RepID=A0ABN1LC19_9ALTE